MSHRLQNSRGLTLIEVLVSITILGIITTAFLSYFTQAYSYTKKNQDQTVGINIARNVLYYMEQQNYQSIKNQYFPSDTNPKEVKLTIDNCKDSVFDTPVCRDFFSTEINNVDYSTTVTLSRDVTNGSQTASPNLSNYLIGVEVQVTWGNQSRTVRGLIQK
ncbi:prepilin-type N-terminal cleavage/methylation domain-containing protein [Neobacillus fumarioli]|uniref:prepilin-type N-terminal cleavage/methylation domain-containing protein n=1 Tax=Neobacillus fumarioli TaxID=105229 RepID=UPI00082DA7F5|nr:prepilin-type N-terminal cleavage/methylation domain-containing protein [Neobacillus fumarioli]